MQEAQSLTATGRVQLDVVKFEPLSPKETAEPSTVTSGASTNHGALVGRRGATGDVKVDDAKHTGVGLKEVVDAVENSVEGRDLRKQK